MANAALTADGYREIICDRATNTSPTRTPLSIIRVGAMDQTPGGTDVGLAVPLPKTATTIDACDAITGWSNSGDADAVSLNVTAGERREGTGSLNMPVTYSSGTAEWSKTISAVDVSSKYVLFYIYLSAGAYASLSSTTNPTLRVILGTGGYTNSNNYDYAKVNLTTGWNLIFIDCDTYDSQNGSGATLSNIDSFKIQLKVIGNITGTDMRMDWIHYCSESDFNISLSANYPVINYSTYEITYRGVVGANEMNNYDITNAALNNGDTPSLHGATIQFNAVTKSSKIIMAVQPKINIQ